MSRPSVVETEIHEGSKKQKRDAYSRTNYGSSVYSGGDVSLTSGKDMRIDGSSVIALGNASLMAGGNLSISSVADENHLDVRTKKSGLFSSSKTETTDDRVTQVSSNVVSGGTLVVAAGNNVTVVASNLFSAGDMVLAAGAGKNGSATGSVSILDAMNTHDTSFTKTKTGFGVGSGEGWVNIYGKKKLTTSSYEDESVGSTLVSGGNLTILAKSDIDIAASSVLALGQATLSAGRDISIIPGGDASGNFYKKEQSGFGIGAAFKGGEASVTIGAHRISRTQQHDETQVVQSVIMGNQGVVIQADRDVLLAAARISSPGDVLVSAGRDLTSITVDQGTSDYYAKKSSQAGLTIGVTLPMATAITGIQQANKSIHDAEKAYRTIDRYTGHYNEQQAVNYINAANKTLDVVNKIDGVVKNLQSSAALIGNADKIVGSLWNDQAIDPNGADKGIKDVLGTVGLRLSIGAASQEKVWTWDQTKAIGTSISGANVALVAGRDLSLEGGTYTAARNLDLSAGHDLLINTGFDTKGSSKETSAKSAEIGFKMQIGYDKGSSSLTAPNFTNGTGISVYGSASTSQSRDWSEASTPSSAKLSAGNNMTMTAGNDLTLIGAQVQAKRDVTLAADNDLTITAAAGTSASHSSASAAGGELSFGLQNSVVGIRANGKDADTDGWGVTWKNSHITAGGALNLNSGNDTTLAGAVVSGKTVNAQVGGDLSIISLQDIARKKGDSKEFGIGLGTSAGPGAFSLSIGLGQTDEKKDWVSEQTKLEGKNGTTIVVAGATTLGGAVVNDKSGKLLLNTGSLSYYTIHDRDYKNNWSFSTGFSVYSGLLAGNGTDNNGWPAATKPDGTPKKPDPKSPGDDFKVTETKGQISYQNRKQEDYATIGSGMIIVGGVDNPDLAGLNRNAAQTQVITQDTYFVTPQLNFNYGAWAGVVGSDPSKTGWALLNAGCSVLSTNCNPAPTIDKGLGITLPWASSPDAGAAKK